MCVDGVDLRLRAQDLKHALAGIALQPVCDGLVNDCDAGIRIQHLLGALVPFGLCLDPEQSPNLDDLAARRTIAAAELVPDELPRHVPDGAIVDSNKSCVVRRSNVAF